jgi:hypothetical protein
MPVQNNAKTMAKSLRDALAERNVSLSHSTCLEIVARQFGFADWNTLTAKLPAKEERSARPTDPHDASSLAGQSLAPSPVIEPVPATTLAEVETHTEMDGISQATGSAAPWIACSFCGKSSREVRCLVGGCGGWEGFRARRDPKSGERSNAFICDECATSIAKHFANALGTAKVSPEN